MEDIDVLPQDDGVLVGVPVAGEVPRNGPVQVSWTELAGICGPYPPASGCGRRRLTILLRLRGALAALGPQEARAVRDAVRVVALPADHVDHLGPGWAVGRVRGGTLWLGPGLTVGDGSGPPLPVPTSLLAAAGVRLADCWPAATALAARLSATAAQLLNRDGPHAGLLVPVGGHDVLTLLAYPALRAGLADGDGVGMRAVAVPQRSRGWWDLTRIDPYYLPLAWQATDEPDRGVPTPLLVTRDEVVAVAAPRRPGGGVSRPWAAPA